MYDILFNIFTWKNILNSVSLRYYKHFIPENIHVDTP